MSFSCAEELSEKDTAQLGELAEKYGIVIEFADISFPIQISHGPIHGENATPQEIKRYLPLFLAEFELYPKDLVTRARLEKVILCKSLAFRKQPRTAIPDYEHNTLMLDVVRGVENENYMRKVLHHEFFHMIDWADDWKVYEDPDWIALNAKDFKYGSGGVNAQGNADTSVLTDKFPGFLNHYSTTGVEEDKAEIFANLVVDAKHVASRLESDAVLKSKVTRMKELLKTFTPAINEEFWQEAKKVSR